MEMMAVVVVAIVAVVVMGTVTCVGTVEWRFNPPLPVLAVPLWR
jgi:hypothetical protein